MRLAEAKAAEDHGFARATRERSGERETNEMLTAENEKLRAALEEYGDHVPHCPKRREFIADCDCGWDKVRHE
jgi:hypothetical protein